VDKKILLKKYHATRSYGCKRRDPNRNFARQRGDNLPPKNSFEKRERFVLISRHFYYFGDNARAIPLSKRSHVEKRGVGFRYLNEDYAEWFERWIKRFELGKHGEPWMKASLERKRARSCKSSC
jgi:Nucleotide modification associated domain 2